MCAHSKPLAFRVEGDHRESPHQGSEHLLDFTMRILSQCHVVRVKALQKNLNQLNHMSLELVAKLHDELP